MSVALFQGKETETKINLINLKLSTSQIDLLINLPSPIVPELPASGTASSLSTRATQPWAPFRPCQVPQPGEVRRRRPPRPPLTFSPFPLLSVPKEKHARALETDSPVL